MRVYKVLSFLKRQVTRSLVKISEFNQDGPLGSDLSLALVVAQL